MRKEEKMSHGKQMDRIMRKRPEKEESKSIA